MYIIPIAFLLASLYSFYKGYKAWTSGSIVYKDKGFGPLEKTESDKRVGWLTIGANVFGIMFLAGAIISFIAMQAEK